METKLHPLDCKCASCCSKRGDTPRHKPGCNCCICKARRGETKGRNHPMFGKSNKKMVESRQKNGKPWFSEVAKQHLKEHHADFSGENNPNWKDGTCHYPYPLDWFEIAESIRKRDNYTCMVSKLTQEQLGYTLHVHHIDGNPSNCNPDNLITLSRECHNATKIKKDKIYWVGILQNIVEMNKSLVAA